MIKKRKLLILFIAAIVICLLFALFHNIKSTKNSIYIMDETSYFNEAYIKDGKVYYLCHLSICNTLNYDVSVNVIGDFSNEYELGVILEKTLVAQKYDSKDLKLNQNSVTEMDVVFVGTHSRKENEVLKANRLLPDIVIHIVNQDLSKELSGNG